MTEAEVPDGSVGEVVEENPFHSEIFEKHGIDYWCNGDRSLEAACRDAGVDVDEVVADLQNLDVDEVEDGVEWETPKELVDVIEKEHHTYLRTELPMLREQALEVEESEVGEHPETREIRKLLQEIADEMLEHVREEEERLFPYVEEVQRGKPLDDDVEERVRAALQGFEGDHDEIAEAFEHLSSLTDGYSAPDDAGPGYQSMVEALKDLERNTHMHIHRENNMLFPRVESHLT